MNTIKINDKEYPFRFSFIAIKKFSKLTGIGMQDLGQMGPDHIAEMLFAGLFGGAKVSRQELDLTMDDIDLFLDANFNKLEEIMELVSADMTGEEQGK